MKIFTLRLDEALYAKANVHGIYPTTKGCASPTRSYLGFCPDDSARAMTLVSESRNSSSLTA